MVAADVGSEISVPKGVVNHKGVYLGGGMVFHNHPNFGETIVPLGKFARGRSVKVVHPGVEDRASFFARLQVSLSNPREYSLLTSNCEHSASWLRTGKASSHQVRIVGLIAFGALAYFASRAR